MSRPAVEALLDVIRDWGADRLFTCPGSTEAAVLDALVVRKDVELVLTTHEGVAVSMADGLARVTRRPTVAYLHANVGLTNGLGHLGAAQLAYSPVVVLNGIKPSSIQAREGFTTAPPHARPGAPVREVRLAVAHRRRDPRGRQPRLPDGRDRAGRSGL